jgi:hypothetical protein
MLPPMEHRNLQLQIRVTTAEKAAIKQSADRAGLDMSAWVLSRLFPQPQQRFQYLTQQLAEEPQNRRYLLAEINDLLSGLDGASLQQAIASPPPAGLDSYSANYVAAIVETAAGRNHLPAPAWTGSIKPLQEPVFGVQTPGLRLYLLTHSPPPFRRRNIFIDSSVGDRV